MLDGGLTETKQGETHETATLEPKGGTASEGFEGREQSIRNRIEQFRRAKEGFWRLGKVDKVKWTPRSEEKKAEYRRQRLRLQSKVLQTLSE